jgi:hypothetical protein
VLENLKIILVFGQSKHLKKKLTYTVYFLTHFYNFAKKLYNTLIKYFCQDNLTIVIIVFHVHFRDINNLVFYSILDQLLLNNFLKNENQMNLGKKIIELLIRFFCTQNYEFKVFVQRFSTTDSQCHLKLKNNVQIIFFHFFHFLIQINKHHFSIFFETNGNLLQSISYKVAKTNRLDKGRRKLKQLTKQIRNRPLQISNDGVPNSCG